MPSLPRELDLICAQAVPWRPCAESSLGSSSNESLVPVPSLEISSSALAACEGFIPGEVDVWEALAPPAALGLQTRLHLQEGLRDI